MICNKKYERPEIKQITKQWVRENCKNITDRDMCVLRTIYENRRRLLRRDQLEILCPMKFASTDRLNKRLKALFNLHIIDKIYPPVGLGEGSSKQYVCLDRAGVILLELEKYNKPITTDVIGNRSLPLGWEHKVMLNDYECYIHQIIQALGGSILDYKAEEPITFNDSKIIPDIFCFIKCNGKGYVFFIEVDMGTEDIPYIKSKLDLYRKFYSSRSWMSTEWCKKFKTPIFPRVMFITENGRDKRVKTLTDYTIDSSIRYYFGCHDGFEDMFESIIKG